MGSEEQERSTEEERTPLTDEEFREYQEKDARTTNRVLGIFSAIWDAITMFSADGQSDVGEPHEEAL